MEDTRPTRTIPKLQSVIRNPNFVEPPRASAMSASRTAASSSTPRTRRRRGTTPRVKAKGGERKSTRPRKGEGTPSPVKELDLAPKGKTSLNDFVAEKQPKTQQDLNAVSVYYLTEILGLHPVTLNHVYTCYKVMGWREPRNFRNSLAVTAHRKLFFDTADMEDIKITPAGRNHVRLDLPPKKKD